jgi:hypothetical protein|tara:strand:- start:446 stop:688 length:243 start_codon:yes stop_codon:yes gene_type:complete
MTITHVKALVISSVADGQADDMLQALAKLCVTDDLLRGERQDIARQAAYLLRDNRSSREWSVNEPVVTCKDIASGKGYRE